MSLEYTIDVQLIELGFQEVLDPRENPVQETPLLPASVDPRAINQSPKPKETLQIPDQQPDDGEQREAMKPTSDVKQVECSSSPPLKTEPHCTPVSTVQSSPCEQAEEGLALDIKKVECTSSHPLKTEPHCTPVSTAQSSSCEQEEEGLASDVKKSECTSSHLLKTEPHCTPVSTVQTSCGQEEEGLASDVKKSECTSSPLLKTEPHCTPVSTGQSSPCEQEEEGLLPVQPEDPSEKDPSSESGTTETLEPTLYMDHDVEDNSDSEEEEVGEEGIDAILAEDELNNSGDYRCSVCDQQLSSSLKLQDHMNMHTGARPYGCVECGKRFCQIHSYKAHLRTHAKSKPDRIECRVCLKDFASLEDLRGHISKTHFEKSYYECDLCKRLFTQLSDCERHVQAHYQMMVRCDRCGSDFKSKKSLAQHLKEACNFIFRCTDCTKTFSTKTALLKHSFSHLGLLPYTCIRCCCHFRLAKQYRKHVCKPERINCVACLREFSCRRDFEQHKKDTGCWGNGNSRGDEIRCLECGQRFDTLEEMKKHTGSHQRVLKCAECGKGFRSALLLMSHMGGHAGQSPCLCQSCGLGFPHQQNYDSHLRTCGQPPQPVSAPKKRQGSRSSSTETKKPDTQPGPSKALAAVEENDRTSSGSAGSAPSNGVWTLSLNTPPPAPCQLILCPPINQTQSMGLAFPSVVSVEIPAVAEQHRPNAALHLPSLDYVSADQHYPGCEVPLDLTKKLESSKPAQSDIPPVTVKSESKKFQFSGENKTSVKRHLEETYTESRCKRFKPDPMDLSSLDDSTEMSRLVIDIKEEPPSPGRDLD